MRLIDVRSNHRLAIPGEWQTVKPIGGKIIYIPIVSWIYETIKKNVKPMDMEKGSSGIKL